MMRRVSLEVLFCLLFLLGVRLWRRCNAQHTAKLSVRSSRLRTMKPLARTQLESALRNYRDEEPYSYGNITTTEERLLNMLGGSSVKTKKIGVSRS